MASWPSGTGPMRQRHDPQRICFVWHRSSPLLRRWPGRRAARVMLPLNGTGDRSPRCKPAGTWATPSGQGGRASC
jgi:hypothetical protein